MPFSKTTGPSSSSIELSSSFEVGTIALLSHELNPALCEYLIVQLWLKLSQSVPDLDDRALKHLEIVSHDELESEGGRHGLLFLLKSFDLDQRLGVPLGTVFGYGMAG